MFLLHRKKTSTQLNFYIMPKFDYNKVVEGLAENIETLKTEVACDRDNLLHYLQNKDLSNGAVRILCQAFMQDYDKLHACIHEHAALTSLKDIYNVEK